jgi:uncharacterized membrane protein
MQPNAATDRTRRLVVAGVAGLAALAILWEMWLAPQRPGGSLLVLKALPLLAALPALARGRVRTFQWWSMAILLYLCEGVVRGMSDASATSRTLGWIEAALASATYAAILMHVRAVRAALTGDAPGAAAGGRAADV